MVAPVSEELATDRLLLRQWRQDDFEEFAAFYADERMAHFVGGIHTREQAWRRMALFAGHWALRGFGYWAVEEKETGALAGGVGLWRPEEWPDLELGYWLVRSAQGKGYAAEAGGAVRVSEETPFAPWFLRFGNTAVTVMADSPPWSVSLLACTAHLDARSADDTEAPSGI